jgi:hypothetical protein
MCDVPPPGGEPLWNVPESPRNFRLNANTAETRENRRLPRTTQRDASTGGLRCAYTQPLSYVALGNSREPPAATFLGQITRLYEYREVAVYMPKRLPSKQWVIAHHMNTRRLFEDEGRRRGRGRTGWRDKPGSQTWRSKF